MFLLRTFKKIKGYVTIKVYGRKAERLINIAMERNIEIWDIKRKKDYMLMSVGVKGYKELWLVCRKLNIPIRINKKQGGPFFLHKLWKRKLFAIGIIFFILALYIFSAFIWFVEVEGLDTINTQEFNQVIEEHDIKRGSLKSKIDTADIERKLKTQFNEIAWVSVNITGTQVLVEVVEKDPADVTEKGPSNIVAAKDGVISKILVLSGQKEVDVGQTVTKNQVLISGQMFNEESRTHMLVRSFGVIEAQVWYEGYGEALPKEIEFKETGNKTTVKYINFFGKNIRVSKKDVPYEKYTKQENHQNLKIRQSDLPIGIVTHTYYEVKGEAIQYSPKQMEEIAKKRAIENAEKKIPEGVEIIDKTVDILEKSGTIVRTKVILETKEEIGIVQRINN